MTQAPPQAPEQPPRRGWFRRHKVLTGLGVIAALIIVIAAVSSGGGGGGGEEATGPAGGSSVTQAQPNDGGGPAKAEPKAEHKKEAPAMTVSQANAVQAAKDYLAMSGFSKAGLIDQLSSKAGDGYPRADARFAVNHIHVNWREQAVRSAKDYLDMSSFSRQGLIDQLSSPYGDQFTRAQAEYAADKVGLE